MGNIWMEILSILMTAKEAGFDTGSILTLGFIAWRLDKRIDKKWDKLIEVLSSHNESNDRRFTKIEDHIGLK